MPTSSQVDDHPATIHQVRNHITLPSTNQVDEHKQVHKQVQSATRQAVHEARRRARVSIKGTITSEKHRTSDTKLCISKCKSNKPSTKADREPYTDYQVHCQANKHKSQRTRQKVRDTVYLAKKVVTYKERDGCA